MGPDETWTWNKRGEPCPLNNPSAGFPSVLFAPLWHSTSLSFTSYPSYLIQFSLLPSDVTSYLIILFYFILPRSAVHRFHGGWPSPYTAIRWIVRLPSRWELQQIWLDMIWFDLMMRSASTDNYDPRTAYISYNFSQLIFSLLFFSYLDFVPLSILICCSTDSKRPRGKLRLLNEVAPLSFLVEQVLSNDVFNLIFWNRYRLLLIYFLNIRCAFLSELFTFFSHWSCIYIPKCTSILLSSHIIPSPRKSIQAGGKASTGTGRILDTSPRGLHDHVPCIMGSFEDVTEAEKYIKNGRWNISLFDVMT